ncbi:hypothetical protein GGX14DRAFT_392469 [Mycena pura]|uniref:Uncharacterized protein n=1 Tax=Mycena pura TaxID=153505 RepID=A0AAD6VN07_9AGAR|nr:hypothetical protein GGX14DRAFT_392469 [Mycena pura]
MLYGQATFAFSNRLRSSSLGLGNTVDDVTPFASGCFNVFAEFVSIGPWPAGTATETREPYYSQLDVFFFDGWQGATDLTNYFSWLMSPKAHRNLRRQPATLDRLGNNVQNRQRLFALRTGDGFSSIYCTTSQNDAMSCRPHLRRILATTSSCPSASARPSNFCQAVVTAFTRKALHAIAVDVSNTV